jgi:RNA polymerase sigma-32 factor
MARPRRCRRPQSSGHFAQAAVRRPAAGQAAKLNSDLLQHANIGLLKAADRFDRQGFSFSYAAWDQGNQDYRSGLVPRKASQFSIRRKLFYNLSASKPDWWLGGRFHPQTPVDRIATDLGLPEQGCVDAAKLAA